MKAKYLLLSAIFISFVSFSQPTIEWQKSLGGSENDGAYSILNTVDGGYIVAGFSQSNDGDVMDNHGGSDYWIIKMSLMGEIEWQKSLGGSEEDSARAIQQTTDGGYIVAGYSHSSDGDVVDNQGHGDYWIVKLSTNGTIEWQKSFGGSRNDEASAIVQTLDGGYIVVGQSESTNGDVTGNHGFYDCWIVKLTSVGDIEWQESYGGSEFDNARSVQQTLDGGYIVAGGSVSNDGDVTTNNGEVDYWVLKLDHTGTLEWQKSFGGSEIDWGLSVQQTIEGGYVVSGHSRSNDGNVTSNHGGYDVWVVKLASTGDIEWQRSLGGSSSEWSGPIQQTLDDGYIVAGSSWSSDGNVTENQGEMDLWIVKLTTTGLIEWQKSLGGSKREAAISIKQTLEGGYIVAGYSSSNDGDVTENKGFWDYWIVKLSPVLSVDENELGNLVILSPNPNSGRFSLDFSKVIDITSINVIDALGKTVYSETNIPSGTFEIDQNFTTGVYFVNVVSTTSETTLKMIVE